MKRQIIGIFLMALLLVSCGNGNKKKLYVFNWTDYISKELIAEFEKKYNCEVVYDTFNSNENMLTKVMNSTVSYDIVCPSADHLVIMKDKGLLEKIDKSKLTDYKNLDQSILLKSAAFDQNNDYGVPYFWGETGLIYNKQKIKESEMQNVSWSILANSKYAKKITMLDDSRSVVGAALIAAGYKFNDMSPEALAKAREILLQWDKNVAQYDSDSYKNEIQDGTVWIAQAYSGDALQIMNQNSNIGFVLPKEGAEMWIDSWVILKNSENKDLAYKFINFILCDAKNAKRNAEFVQYATPNAEAFKMLPNEVKTNSTIYPPKEYMDKCEPLKFVGEKIVNLSKVWDEIRNN